MKLLKQISLILTTTFILLNAGNALASQLPYLDESLQDPKTDKPLVMVDFHSKFCGTCITVEPYYVVIRKNFAKDVTFKRINMDRFAGTKMGDKYSVDGTPTYILFDGITGKPLYRMKDVISISALQKQLMRFSNRLTQWRDPLLTPHINKKKDGYTLVSFRQYKPCDQLCQRAQGAVNSMSYAMDGQMPGIFLDASDDNTRELMRKLGFKRDKAYALFDNKGRMLYTQEGELNKEQMWENIQMLTELNVD